MIPALIGTLAIVTQDHAALRSAPRTNATELVRLWEGDVLEVRGEVAGYLKVYDTHRERGGYLRADAAHAVELSPAAAPELLAVLRFLRDRPGSETLGISYGAAYLRAAPAQALDAEPFEAIARMAERLADQASGSAEHLADFAPHLDVVAQFGVRMRELERNGRMRVCYDGELYRRVLSFAKAAPQAQASAVLGLTRPDCLEPDLGPVPRAALDADRARLLERVKEADLDVLTRSRLHARAAGVWAAIAYEQDRRAQSSAAGEAAERAREELLAVHPDELGEDRRAEYLDAVLRVSAVRWAGAAPVRPEGQLRVSVAPGDPGQTCLAVEDTRRRPVAVLLRRCTYGIVRLASVRSIAADTALLLAVQPLESWRELWVVHRSQRAWTIDVLSPGLEDPEEGYIEFAGYVPGSRRLLIAREVKVRGRFRRSFEELRLDDLALMCQASSPELLRDFGRWQDATWRRDTLALH